MADATNTSKRAAREAQRQQSDAATQQQGEQLREAVQGDDAPKEDETFASADTIVSGPTADRDPLDEKSNACMLGGNAEEHDAEFVTTSKAVNPIKFCSAHRPANYQTLGYEKISSEG